MNITYQRIELPQSDDHIYCCQDPTCETKATVATETCFEQNGERYKSWICSPCGHAGLMEGDFATVAAWRSYVASVPSLLDRV